jgi:cytoskeletal protein RodZ
MPTVAELLKQGREKQKLTVSQLAETTKIRSDHIRALEEGNYQVFSAPVYIRGFVRTLASTLRLSVPEVMKVLDDELSQSKKFREPPKLTAGSRGIVDFLMLQLSKVNWRVALPLLIVAVVSIGGFLAYRSWRLEKSRDPLRTLGPGLYKPKQLPGGDMLPVPTNAPKR